MSVAQEIHDRLSRALAPRHLEILDESARHKGHAGARPGGESHFRVTIVSDAFEGKSRIERHRMVTGALKDLMAEQIHALALTAATPGEAEAAGG